jgi:hypothetical protein
MYYSNSHKNQEVYITNIFQPNTTKIFSQPNSFTIFIRVLSMTVLKKLKH